MLVDSAIIIDLTRGYPPAKAAFEKLLYGQSVSIMTVYELVIGTSSKIELNSVFKMLKSLDLKVLPINEDVSRLAQDLLIKYRHSHGLGIQDALIAATAIINNEEFVTRNRKHFNFIPNLKIITPY